MMKILSTLLFLCAITSWNFAQDTNKVKTAEPIVDFAEVEPQYPGGDSAMVNFIRDNVTYPEESREMGEQGTVYVQFVVNTDGSISEVEVIRGVSQLLDEEAMRVIKLMPNWIPGMQQGKPVRVRYRIPIKFSISTGRADKKKRKGRS